MRPLQEAWGAACQLGDSERLANPSGCLSADTQQPGWLHTAAGALHNGVAWNLCTSLLFCGAVKWCFTVPQANCQVAQHSCHNTHVMILGPRAGQLGP
jgi:hypothetical protein